VLARGPVLELDGELERPRRSPAAREAENESVRAAGAQADGPDAAGVSLEEMERRHILVALERAGWVIEGGNGAARALGLHPSTLRSRMKKLGVRRATDA
jgi:transcriptional regulator with GAF, ATPase, and Fis domain